MYIILPVWYKYASPAGYLLIVKEKSITNLLIAFLSF